MKGSNVPKYSTLFGDRKPHPDYPLTPRGDGRWCKKIRGKFHYFVGTAEEALDEWLRVKDDLLAGRKPRAKDGEMTVLEVCDRFLVSKRQQVEEGTLKQLSWNDYKATCDRIIGKFGRTRAVADLRSEDFEQLRAAIAKTRGLTATGNEIQRVRVVFKYAYDSDLIDRPVKFGPAFKRAAKKVLRKAKEASAKKLFTSDEIRQLVGKAGPAMKAMIHLAINGGLGNSDIGHLPLAALDLERGSLDFPRPKTGCARRCPLWPETIDAINHYLTRRPKPKTVGAETLLFVTRCGEPWAKDDKFDNPVTKEFRKLLNILNISKHRCGFYWLRHTFRTIAGGAKDEPATNLIMGHSDGTMAELYTEEIEPSRLLAIVNHVRAWLFRSQSDKSKRPKTPKPRTLTSDRPPLRVIG
jgi:integrase